MSEGPNEPSFADVLNGISGGPGKRRGERRGFFRRRSDDPPETVPDEHAGGGPQRSGTGPSGGVDAAPPGSLEPTPPWGLDRLEHLDDESDGGPPDEGGDEASFVRPYAWTGGRTRPVYQLAVETLISLGPQGRDPSLVRQYEHRAVADLCREPVSVAEVAALLKLPLGVARVLLGDMASQGTVVVHQTASTSEEGPDMALMERVLSGLRRL